MPVEMRITTPEYRQGVRDGLMEAARIAREWKFDLGCARGETKRAQEFIASAIEARAKEMK